MSASEASHRLRTTVGNAPSRLPRWSDGNQTDSTAETDYRVPKLRARIRATSVDFTTLQVDTSDAFLVTRTVSEPGTGATATTTQELSATVKATATILVCSIAYLRSRTGKDSPPTSNGEVEGPP